MAMIVLSLAVVAVFSVPTVFAAGDGGDLLIDFTYDGEKINDAEFGIYKVADFGKDDEILIAKDFAPYENDVKALKTKDGDPDNAGEWKGLAELLQTYIVNNNIQPLKTIKTGDSSSGRAAFGKLDKARYLVVGKEVTKTVEKDGKNVVVAYTPEPFWVDMHGKNRTAIISKLDVKDKTDKSIKAKKVTVAGSMPSATSAATTLPASLPASSAFR